MMIRRMKTLIENGWVVAWNGTSHEVYERGSVVIEDDRIVHAGGPYAGPVDTRLSARGKLVSPGFINTHVHTAGGGGDYLLLDMAKNDYRTANYMSFAAPLRMRCIRTAVLMLSIAGRSSSTTRTGRPAASSRMSREMPWTISPGDSSTCPGSRATRKAS